MGMNLPGRSGAIAGSTEATVHVKAALGTRAAPHRSDVDTSVGHGGDGKAGCRARPVLEHAADATPVAVIKLGQGVSGESVKHPRRGTHRLPGPIDRPEDTIGSAI